MDRQSSFTSGKRILIADPSGQVRHSLADFLKRTGYRVVETGCGAEALATLRSHDIDLSILDRGIRNPDLFTIIAEMHDDHIESPFIITSDENSKEIEYTIRTVSSLPYFIKPVDYHDIRAVIERVLNPVRAGTVCPRHLSSVQHEGH